MTAKPLLVCRYLDGDANPKLSVYCVGYEQTRWRAQELVRDFFRRLNPDGVSGDLLV